MPPIDSCQCIDNNGCIDFRQCHRRCTVSRIQLALSVSDIDASVDFYSKVFEVEPAKRRPGYANFAISDPPLKVNGPGNEPWEIHTVLADLEMARGHLRSYVPKKSVFRASPDLAGSTTGVNSCC